MKRLKTEPHLRQNNVLTFRKSKTSIVDKNPHGIFSLATHFVEISIKPSYDLSIFITFCIQIRA